MALLANHGLVADDPLIFALNDRTSWLNSVGILAVSGGALMASGMKLSGRGRYPVLNCRVEHLREPYGRWLTKTASALPPTRSMSSFWNPARIVTSIGSAIKTPAPKANRNAGHQAAGTSISGAGMRNSDGGLRPSRTAAPSGSSTAPRNRTASPTMCRFPATADTMPRRNERSSLVVGR